MPASGPYRDVSGVVFDLFACDRPPPLSSIDEFVKQIDMSRLSADALRAISIAAPRFTERLVFEKELNNLRRYLYQGIVPEQRVDVVLNRHGSRRFSGGDDLGRGAYHTIVQDESGDDLGTLLQEMRAYCSFSWAGSVQILDDMQIRRMKPEARKFYEGFGEWDRSVAILFEDLPRAPSRYFATYDPAAHADFVAFFEDGARIAGIRIPYTVEKIRRENVFDLRRKEAQQWLTRFFGETLPMSDPDGRPIFVDSFFDTFTIITAPKSGGSLGTEIVGAILRAKGAGGIVFPSARASSSVTYDGDRVEACQGWVFLDYSKVPPQPPGRYIKVTSEWSLRSPVELSSSLKVNSRGWSLTGLFAQWNRLLDGELRAVMDETEEQREAREFDYLEYRRIVGFFDDAGFRDRMNEAMLACNLQGGVERISLREWQYVLEFVNVSDQIPRLDNITPISIPMGLSLLGYTGPPEFIET